MALPSLSVSDVSDLAQQAVKPALPPPRARAPRWVRVGVRLLVFVPLLAALVIGVVGWQLLESRKLGEWILREGLPRLNGVIPGEIRVGSSTGELGHHLVFNDVEILDERGEPCIRARRVEVFWEAIDLLDLRGAIRSVVVVDPWVLVDLREDGTLNLSAAFVAPRIGPSPEKKPVDWKIRVDQIDLHGGAVEVRRPGQAAIQLDGIVLEGAWSMHDAVQDAAIRELRVVARSPWDLGELSLRGGLHLDGSGLDVDALNLAWRTAALSVSGQVGPIGSPDLALQVEAEALDLVWFREFHLEAPLRGVIDASLQIHGPVSRLGASGTIRTAQGGLVTIRDAHVEPTADPIGHGVDLDLSDFDLREILTLEDLPGPLSLALTWDGTGRRVDELTGDLSLHGRSGSWRGIQAGPVRLDGRIEARRLTVTQLEAAIFGGRVAGRGNADLLKRTFSVQTEATLPRLAALPASWKVPLGGSGLSLSAEARGSWAATDGPKDQPRIQVRTVGSAQAATVEKGALMLAGIDLRWDLDTTVPREGTAKATGPVHLTVAGARSGDQILDQLRLDADLAGEQASVKLHTARGSKAEGSAAAKAPIDLEFEGTVDWRSLPTVRVKGRRLALTAGLVSLRSREPFSLKTREGAVQLDGLTLDAGPGSVLVGGQFHPGVEASITARILDIDLARLAPLLPPETALTGQLDDLTVKVRGALSSPRIELRLDGRAISVRGRGPLDVHADAVAADGSVAGTFSLLELVTLQLGRVPLQIRLDGQGPPVELLADGAWEGTLELPRASIRERLASLALTVPDAVAGAQAQARLVLGGTTRNPTLAVTLSVSDLPVAGQDAAIRIGAELKDGRLALADSSVRLGGATVLDLDGGADLPLGAALLALLGPAEGRGPLPRMLGGVSLGAKLRKLPMSLIHSMVPVVKPLTGALQGELLVRGEAASPTIDLDLRLLGGRLGGQVLESAIVDLALVDSVLKGTIDIVPEGGGRLRLTPRVTMPLAFDGSRPLSDAWSSDDLRVEVEGNGFPLQLATAFIPGTLESAGRIELHGMILGSLTAAVPKLTLGVQGGRLCLSQTSVCWEDLGLDLRWEKGEIILGGLGFRTVPVIKSALDASRRPAFDDVAAKRRIDLHGRVAMEGFQPTEMELRAALDDAWLIFTPEWKVQSRGNLRADGRWPALVVDGDVDLTSVSVDLGKEDIGRELQPLELPGHIVVHREKSVAGPGEIRRDAANRPAWLEQSRIRVGVHLGNHVRVKLAVGVARQDRAAGRALNLLGSIEPDLLLRGDVTVRMERGRTTLEGAIATRPDSRLEILTKRFDLDAESTITFVGDPLDTRLALRGAYQSRYGPITTVVGGTVSAPSLDFQSEAFSEPADMISVLITGKPMDELTAAEGKEAQGGLARVLGGFASEIAGKLVPLDTVEVDLQDGSAGSAELGKQLASNVFLLTRFRWGSNNQENRVEAEVQIQITPIFYVEARIGDLLKGAAEALFRYRF